MSAAAATPAYKTGIVKQVTHKFRLLVFLGNC